MKSAVVLFISALLVLLVYSCGKESAAPATSTVTTTTNTAVTTQYLYVIADKTQITADGTDQVKFTIRDASYIDVTSSATIYVNNKALTTNTFSTTTVGTYQVMATKGSVTSPIVTITAVSASSNTGTTGNVTVSGTYTQKTLVEFFTATWCGSCPGTLIPLETYIQSNPNTIMVGIHGPVSSPDPYNYIYYAQLTSAFGIIDQPNELLNRSFFWNTSESSLNTLAKNTAVLGVGLQSSVSGSAISVNVSVKFGVTITAPVAIVVYLVEDGLVYDQVNDGYYNLPNPIPGFVHHNVLRAAATDVFGDDIPYTQTVTNNIWQKAYTFDASKYVVSNCKIVAFVTYVNTGSSLKGVLNTQIVNAGQSISY